MVEVNTIKTLYSREFNIDEYLKQYYSSIDEEETFFLKQLGKIEQKIKGLKGIKKTSISNNSLGHLLPNPRTVVEIGSGPLISGLVSASSWADLLIFSDLVESNRERIKETLSNVSSSPYDLSSLNFVADIEGINAEDLITRLERLPKIVTESDLFFPSVLHPSVCLPQPPAVVIMKLCLEFSMTSNSDIVPALSRVASLIARGGFLVIMGALGNVTETCRHFAFSTPQRIGRGPIWEMIF